MKQHKSDLSIGLYISTMNGEIKSSNYPLGDYQLHIINQGKPMPEVNFATVHNIDSKGLSKSRNYALSIADTDVVVIGDNDVMYVKDFEKKIAQAYAEHSKADCLLFRIKTPEGEFFNSHYPNSAKKLKSLDLLHRCSIEITFLKNTLGSLNFDERFGLGSYYKTGEDIIFLNDLYKNKRAIIADINVIGVHPRESSGLTQLRSNLRGRQKMFTRAYGLVGNFLFILLIIKKGLLKKFILQVIKS